MPKVPEPTLKANQAVVPTSAATRGVADFRNSSTLISLPDRAYNVARIPTLFMRRVLKSGRDMRRARLRSFDTQFQPTLHARLHGPA
jgi:hypothetical protein